MQVSINYYFQLPLLQMQNYAILNKHDLIVLTPTICDDVKLQVTLPDSDINLPTFNRYHTPSTSKIYSSLVSAQRISIIIDNNE